MAITSSDASVPRSRSEPWWPIRVAAFLIAVGLFEAWVWIDTSGIRYDGRMGAETFTTAGWFVLGQPFIGLVAFGYAVIVVLLLRRRRWIAMSALLVSIIATIAWSTHEALPEARIRRIVGEQAASQIQVRRLYESDSFNEGTWTWGVLSAPESTMQAIADHLHLRSEENASLNLLQNWLKGESLPEMGTLYRKGQSQFFFDTDSERIYFLWHPRGPS